MGMWRILSIVFIYWILNAEAKPNKKIVLTWKEIISCPDYTNEYSDMSTVQMYMANETTIRIKGKLDIKVDLDAPVQMKATVEKEVGAGSFMTILNYEADLCEKLAGSDNDWNTYTNLLVPIPSKCPLAKNTYDVGNVQPQSTDLQLKKDMIGNYKSTIKMYRVEKTNGIAGVPKMWGCYQLNFNVELPE